MATAHSDFQEVGTLLERFTKISLETKEMYSDEIAINNKRKPFRRNGKRILESRSDPADARF